MTAPAPTILAQITDPHIRLDDGGLSAAGLSAAVDAVMALATSPDAVIVTGDLVDHPGRAEYELVGELLAPFGVPVHVLAGNHDDRDALRAAFPLGPADPRAAYRYAATVRELALIGFDTTIPGHVEGATDDEGIAWLDEQLGARPETPTVLAMHHPPIATGNRAIDWIGLGDSDRLRISALLARHPQVQRVICGHVHTTVFGTAGGCPVVACAGTGYQLPFAIPGGEDLELVAGPGAIALHVLADGALTTHVRSLRA
ncbi:MAG: phosphodiesterase [Actinomycetota bacterium]|nr:phosphodiesterase [Actinomycetota bacterium]